MDPRKFALFGGILMLVLGALALVPNFVGSAEGLPLLRLNESYGLFAGILPMNIVNKIVLVLFGAAGIYVSSLKGNALPRSILFSRIVFVVMGLGAILGLIPQTSTFFGYWPLYGNEVLLHAVFSLIGGYFGFALSMKAHREIQNKPSLRETFQVSR